MLPFDAHPRAREVFVNLEPKEGFSLRAVTVSDAEAVADVINECTRAEIGLPWTTPEEVRDQWSGPGYDLPADALVVDGAGEAAGYLQLWCDIDPFDELFSLVYVRPRYWSRGLSAFLLRSERSGRANGSTEPRPICASRTKLPGSHTTRPPVRSSVRSTTPTSRRTG